MKAGFAAEKWATSDGNERDVGWSSGSETYSSWRSVPMSCQKEQRGSCYFMPSSM